MYKQRLSNEFLLYGFSIIICVLAYCYPLTNYILTVDSESPVFPDYSMGLGRWGTNLIRYHIFEGLLPYITLLIGLVFLALSAVEMTKIFKFQRVYAFIFCALFLSFPQHAYQLAFTMQADAVPIGIFCSILGINIFLSGYKNIKTLYGIGKLILSCLLITFSIAVYQALVLIPATVYAIYFFNNTFKDDYNTKRELKEAGLFIVLMIISSLFYYISVKLFCPPVEGGYLSSYTSGNSGNRFSDFYDLLVANIKGNFYYGEKTYLFASLAGLIIFIKIFINRNNLILKIVSLIGIVIAPYIISFFITNGYNPPRLYVASTMVYGFLITFLLHHINFKFIRQSLFTILIIVLANIYFITNLFYSANKIFMHDLNVAHEINNTIVKKYPKFDSNSTYVYFYGALPMSNYEKIQLPNTDVFSGSLFRWDGGSNWRIINFFRVNDIGYYRFLDDKQSFNKIKDSIQQLPVWPDTESVKQIDNVIIVKIGDTPGVPLPIQQ